MRRVFCCLASFLALAAGSFSGTAASEYGSLAYRSIGPAISGGRTTAVAGSDANPQIYYAGGAGGGVFKSWDGGSSWTPIFDKADVAPVGAIAVAANDPNDVWVGTGESNPRNDVEEGDGIWHSRDGGKTWTHSGLPDAGSISAITIDPRNAHRVAVGVLGHIFRDSATRGIYVTGDGGKTWKHALFAGPACGASDVVRVPDRPQTLFAGIYEFRRKPWTMTSGGAHGGLYRSNDGGLSWRKLTGNGLPVGLTGRIGLAAGTGGRMYAAIQSSSGNLWRSDDGGVHWNAMPPSWLTGNRRFYFSRIFVDPNNNDRLINVGLILSMSKNGGRTFSKIATEAGWDYHVAWWSANGKRIAVGSDEGLVISDDGGARWRQPYALPFSQPYHIGFDNALPNYHVCAGLQDNDTWCGLSNGPSGIGVLNRDWWTVAPGDGMWALYDPADPNLVWSTSTNNDTGQVYLFDTRTQSANEISPVARSNGSEPGINLTHRFNWDTPIAFDGPSTVLAGGEAVFRTTDRGQHWTIISPDLTRNDRTHQTIPGGPIDADMSGAEMSDTILDLEASGGVIWVGTDDGLVQVTRDAGAHWMNVTPHAMPQWARVSTVDVSPYDRGTAFAAGDNHMLGDDSPHLFATRNYGVTWTSIAGDLPSNVFVRTIRQDPRNENVLYAGTQRGVFASWDSGRHWRSLRLNMPATAIYDIEVQPAQNDLLVASHGRGVWVLDDIGVLQYLQSGPVALWPVRPAYRWLRFSPVNSFDGRLPSNQFAGENIAYGAIITYALPNGSQATIDVLDAQGRVIKHLRGKSVPQTPGLNRAAWNLTEDGPIKWTGTFADNQGPANGAEVLPGTYTVRLRAAGKERSRNVQVLADPRDTLTTAQMQARYTFLRALLGDLSGTDAMLNAIDRRTSHGDRSSAVLQLRRKLTYDPRNTEDLSGPAGYRERLLDLIGRLSGNYQAPTQPQLNEAAVLENLYVQLFDEYKALKD